MSTMGRTKKASMHNHPGGMVVVISGGHLRFTDQHGNVQEVFSKAASPVVPALQTQGGEPGEHSL